MTTFAELNLARDVARAVQEAGYEVPTPVQAQSIPAALEGSDILGCAQTGTGKTAAFALPMLSHFADKKTKAVAKRPVGLIISPTRELALQIGESFNVYGRHTDITYAVIYGGVGQGRQVQAVESGAHVLIATPGRLLDLIGQGVIFLNRLQVFVVDEADRLMDMGFLPDLKRIIKYLPVRRQSLFFSATMPPKITRLAETLLHKPLRVDIEPEKTNVELIDQRVIFADHRQKKPLLVKLITAGDVGQAIVFTRTKRGANSVAEYLRHQKIDAQPIHGNLTQNARQRVLNGFREDKIQILVATDLASRGIDVEGLSHVFNFELPNEPENYIHRIGRTGRAGSKGIAISLCSEDEKEYLQEIEKLIGFEILQDGREPDPLPQAASEPPKDGAKKSRNRRSRRSRRGRGGSRTPDAREEAAPTEGSTETTGRPTAAQRKAARNRRRRRAKRNAEDADQ